MSIVAPSGVVHGGEPDVDWGHVIIGGSRTNDWTSLPGREDTRSLLDSASDGPREAEDSGDLKGVLLSGTLWAT